MEFENIIKLIESVSKSELSSFTLEEGDTKITLEAGSRGAVVVTSNDSAVINTTASTPNFSAANSVSTSSVQTASVQDIANTGNTAISGNVIKSPLVGVFYNAPAPDADSFVKVGDKVKVGQTLGIIEAMKLMNEIECEYDGEVKDILIKNGDVIEFGQPLFVIG